MESKNSSNRIHPLVAAAAVSVMLVSLIGVAAITGVLPNSNSTTTPSSSMNQTKLVSNQATPGSTLGSNQSDSTAYITEPADPKYQNSEPPRVVSKPVVKQHQPTYSTQHTSQPSRPVYVQHAQAPVTPKARQICHHCGRIESVQAVHQQAKPSGLGVAAGAVIGGLLGNQVGDGRGRTLATVAGAVGGGYAGNEVEKRNHTNTSYQVRVRMEDGAIRTFPQSGQNGWQVGDRVRVVNGALTSEG